MVVDLRKHSPFYFEAGVRIAMMLYMNGFSIFSI